MLLTEADFNTHIYSELISNVDRNDEGLLLKAIRAGESQAKGYLSRYNTDSLFAASGDARDELLMTYCKDLAAWHFITIGNPGISIDFYEMRYDQAIRELGKIQSGKVVPDGWPAKTTPTGSDTFFHSTSAKKRDTRW